MDAGVDVDRLVAAARAVAEKAYVPYSNFRVGVAVVADDESVYAGCNVENAAYGSTVCAEVNAITTAVAEGRTGLVAAAVSALDGDDVFPCGNCRQVMVEFGIDTLIIDAAGGAQIYRLADVLPHSFGPEDLGHS